MTLSWLPVIWIDIVGSSATLVLALLCPKYAWHWATKKRDDTFRHYIFFLTLSFAFFAVSRSFGHLVKQVLLFYEMNDLWKAIAPFSGSINTATFITVFAFSLYFYRSYMVHLELETHKNHLEKMIEMRTAELKKKNTELKTALSQVKTLSGFLPICASCKKIRDDNGYWNQIESYIRNHSEAEFSHGICPDCAQKLYPNYLGNKKER
jgi:hypothetical protein